MRRPIEQVKRQGGVQYCVLIWNILNMVLFFFLAVNNDLVRGTKNRTIFQIFDYFSFFMALMTVFFYVMIWRDPGYVPKRKNFLKLLDKLLEENYHLDYVCVHCETL